jgi:hypothetical protein
MSWTSTSIVSPTLTASSTLARRLPLPSFEMWISPSRPGTRFTKAPNVVVLTTEPVKRSPTVIGRGFAISSMIRAASSAPAPSRAPTNTVPSSWMSMSAPVIATISLILLPLGPITSPILSTGMCRVRILGALGLTSLRGSGIAWSITSRIFKRASFAWSSAPARTSPGSPVTFMSSWIAVTMSFVPATLKSMSPSASSAPRMSVNVTNVPPSAIIPIAIPATGALIGTPASINDSVEAHTLAIEVEPFEETTSETSRSA